VKSEPDAAIRQCLIVAVVALAWVATFELNAAVFPSLEHSARASWIFLPAALRPLAILMFGGLGALGLVLGAFLTVYGTSGGSTLHEIVLAVSSGLLPWAAVSVGKAMFKLPDSLAGVRPKHIVALSAMCAGSNALGLNAYLWLAGRLGEDLMHIPAVFVGDAFGSAIVLLAASAVLTVVFPRRSLR
jgi:hypothetical protein